MKSPGRSLTNFSALLTGIISLIVAVFIPVTYFIFAYEQTAGAINSELAYAARTVETLVANNPRSWQFEEIRLLEILERRLEDHHPEQRVIKDRRGQVIAATQERPVRPTAAFRQDIYDSGIKVASIAIERSIVPLLGRTAGLGVFSGLMGIMIFLVFYYFPLRTVRENAARLLETEKQFRLITDNVRDTVWLMDMNFQPTWVSPSVEHKRGFTSEELCRLPLERHLTASSLGTARALAARALAPEKLANPRENISFTVELEFLRKDGSPLWADTVITLLRDAQGAPTGFLGLARDMTERRTMEEALRASEELYTRLVDTIPDVIVRTDLQGQILFVNSYTLQISGYSREEIQGQNILLFIAPEDHSQALRNVKLMLEGFKGPREYNLIMKDGKRIPFEINSDVLRGEDGAPFGLVSVCRNITERRRAEEALQKAHAELEQRVAERTHALTLSNINLKELLLKQDVNIDLAKNILAMINYRPRRHNLIRPDTDLFFTSFYLPCYAEGGDHFFIKYFSLRYPGIHKTAISLKDQSGHEVSCILRSIITDLVHNTLLVNALDFDLKKTITHLNREICRLPFFGEDNFFTAINAEIDHESLKMSYISAGHPPFLLIRGPDVACLPPPEGPGSNLPIGILQSIDFQAGEIQLSPGDKLIFYTDGLTDMPHISGRPVLNAEDLRALTADLVRAEPRLPVSLLMARLFNRINGQEGDNFVIFQSFEDDITLLGLEMENNTPRYEDTVRPADLADLDLGINKLFRIIRAEWEDHGFLAPETRLRMVLEEAVVNAWKHGNREDPQKSIVIRRRYGNDAVLEVIDEGEGFDSESFYDPTMQENILKPAGRGNFIIRLLTRESYWLDGGRHLVSFFAREDQREHTGRSFAGINLWRRRKM